MPSNPLNWFAGMNSNFCLLLLRLLTTLVDLKLVILSFLFLIFLKFL